MSQTLQIFKQQAAEYAVDHYVRSGMVVGLGEGSTAVFAIRYLAQQLQAGALRDLLMIPCSENVRQLAQSLQLPLSTLEDHPRIDVTIDGADEVSPALDLIKGGGGALLREKIVAQASRQEVIVVDEGKLVPQLGSQWPLPLEVLPFGWGAQMAFLEGLGGRPVLRQQADGQPAQTDQGNYLIDCHFGVIEQPSQLAAQLAARAGILEHGLFIGLAAVVVVAGEQGLRVLERPTLQ